MKNLLVFSLFVLLFCESYGQNSLKVVDEKAGVPIAFALIEISSALNNVSGVSDQNGICSFSKIPSGELTISVSHLNYQLLQKKFENLPVSVALVPKSFELRPVVITGQIYSSQTNNTVKRIRNLDGERLANTQNLSELLQFQSGLGMSMDGATGTSSIRLLGVGGNNVKILKDGIPLAGRTGFEFDLGQTDIDDAARVEVVEGPMSVEYGSNALAGVVNIISAPIPNQTFSLNALLTSGVIQKNNFNITEGIQQQKLTLSLSDKEHHAFRFKVNHKSFSGIQITSTERKQDWDPKGQLFVEFEYRYKRKEWIFKLSSNPYWEEIEDLGNYIGIFDPVAIDFNYKSKRWVNSLQVKRITNSSRFDFDLSNSIYTRNIEQFTTNLLNSDSRKIDSLSFLSNKINSLLGRASYSINTKSSGHMRFGTEFNSEEASGDRIESGLIPSFYELAFYGNYERRLNRQIKFNFGARVGHNSMYKMPFLPSANVLVELKNHWLVRASYAKGFRAPSLRELYFDFKDTNHSIVGNKDLKAEESNFYELSASKTFTNTRSSINSKYSVMVFYNEVENMIDYGQTPGDLGLLTLMNVSDNSTLGARVRWNAIWKDKLELEISPSFLANRASNQLEGLSGEDWFLYPEIAINASYKINKKTGFGLSYKYTGENRIWVNNGIEEAERGSIPSYQMMNLRITQKFTQNLNMSLHVNNIFNVSLLQASNSKGTHSGNSALVGYGRNILIKLNYNLKSK